MTPAPLQSRLDLPGIRCMANIGHPDDEAAQPQAVLVALRLVFDEPPAASRTDDLSDTVDYARLTETVTAVSASRRYRLLESLVQEIYDALLPTFRCAVRLWVEVKKERSPIPALDPSASFGLGSISGASAPGVWQPVRPSRPGHTLLRPAVDADRPRLRELIAASAHGLAGPWYTPAQIAGTLEAEIWGVDSELLRDGTCFVIEKDGEIAATGAWGRRATKFGGDAWQDRTSRLLDPESESARIRAFFVHPGHSRRGLGTAILRHCEEQAASAGFRSAELIATLSGEAFYRAHGYAGRDRVRTFLSNGSSIEFVPMWKPLVSRASFVGVLNITEDSFSDGGCLLDPSTAIAHGERLLDEGADWLDVGAESSNPAGQAVAEELQIARLAPVLKHFVSCGARLSVDTHRPAVMRAALDFGAQMVNDVTALAEPDAVRLLATRSEPVVIMFSRNHTARASAAERSAVGVVEEARTFFGARMEALEGAGIGRERLILDPGMGFFLGGNPGPSVSMLREFRALSCFGRPLYVSTSRKSFIGALTGGRPPAQRAFGTVASELWALTQGAAFIRTHDVRAIKDAWALWRAIEKA